MVILNFTIPPILINYSILSDNQSTNRTLR